MLGEDGLYCPDGPNNLKRREKKMNETITQLEHFFNIPEEEIINLLEERQDIKKNWEKGEIIKVHNAFFQFFERKRKNVLHYKRENSKDWPLSLEVPLHRRSSNP